MRWSRTSTSHSCPKARPQPCPETPPPRMPFPQGCLAAPAPPLCRALPRASSSTTARRAPAMVIFALFVIVLSLPFVPVATGHCAGVPLGNTQDTRFKASGSGSGGVGRATPKRRAGCKPLLRMDLPRFADARSDCDSLRYAAAFHHTPDNQTIGRVDHARLTRSTHKERYFINVFNT